MFKRLICIGLGIVHLLTSSAQEQQTYPELLGMYVHQGWSYNHPYATRTWTLTVWRNYLEGIDALGYNSVLIWPMLETMPNPLTTSDQDHVDKIQAVIELAHRDFKMKAYIVLCPNIRPKSDLASKYTFENRPLYGLDEYIDPSDPIKLGALMQWREKLFEPLKAADGIFVIDSDPGGYANSTNVEFAYLLTAHRRMLDRLRPGIELYYWAWTGWESYGRFHATGHFEMGTQQEIQDALNLIERQQLEPWGVATHWLGYGPRIDAAMQHRVLAYNYGAIEGEPAFPLTIYGGDGAYDGGKQTAQRGVFGNAQNHCVQLPNTFAFARGAQGLSAERADYVIFGNQLIEGAGEVIVTGWEALQGADVQEMRTAASQLDKLKKNGLLPGRLKGLLFGDPRRFVEDLISQLHMVANLFACKAVLDHDKGRISKKGVEAFDAFIAAVDDWHGRHGYNSYWYWPAMTEVLMQLPADQLAPFLGSKPWWEDGEGETPGERIGDAYEKVQTYTPRLIAAMKATSEALKKTIK